LFVVCLLRSLALHLLLLFGHEAYPHPQNLPSLARSYPCANFVRNFTGYALAGKGMDTRRLQHFLGHASITNTVRYTAMSPEPFKDVWRR